jgi:hypothetical protein
MKEECCSLGHAVQYLLYNHNISTYSNQTARAIEKALQNALFTQKARRSSAWRDTVRYIITGTSNNLFIVQGSLRSFIEKGICSYVMPLLFPSF